MNETSGVFTLSCTPYVTVGEKCKDPFAKQKLESDRAHGVQWWDDPTMLPTYFPNPNYPNYQNKMQAATATRSQTNPKTKVKQIQVNPKRVHTRCRLAAVWGGSRQSYGWEESRDSQLLLVG